MTNILLGALLLLWSFSLLGIAAISSTVLGVLALIVGIVLIVSGWVPLPTIPTWKR